ncbi:uncharacterized protein LOC116802343 [Drosophila sechellia]|uniref:uncharacterized protein LOC116802343 n=1 Tax=Drosophila sechellia TaxID=7238 RepID=UPI0013DDE30F|nr:uncharacterized protein LOC116802343 [Drosophila sechellia]
MCAQSGSSEPQASGFGKVGVSLPDYGAAQVAVPFCGPPEMGMYNSRAELVQLKPSLHQHRISICSIRNGASALMLLIRKLHTIVQYIKFSQVFCVLQYFK